MDLLVSIELMVLAKGFFDFLYRLDQFCLVLLHEFDVFHNNSRFILSIATIIKKLKLYLVEVTQVKS